MKDIAGIRLCRHTNLLLQNGLTIGVIALQRPRPIFHALPVSTPCKRRVRSTAKKAVVVELLQILLVLLGDIY